jgi:hypothetical protein
MTRDHVVADTSVSRQQDLRPLDLARRMLRRELCTLGVAQIDPVSYVHR